MKNKTTFVFGIFECVFVKSVHLVYDVLRIIIFINVFVYFSFGNLVTIVYFCTCFPRCGCNDGFTFGRQWQASAGS